MRKILVVFLALLLPITAIAEDFGCMDVVAYATKHTGSVPEQLKAYVQPLDIMAVDGAIRVQLIDALFVDGAVAAAWTVENISDEPLYIDDKKSIGGMPPIAYWYNSSVGILQPGETRYCGFAGYLEDWMISNLEGDKQMLSVHVAGMRLLGEPVCWDEIADGALREADFLAKDREISRLFAEDGKIVIDHDGRLIAGQGGASFYYDDKAAMPPAAQMYIQSGKLAHHSLVCIETPLKMDVAARSIMPEEPIDVTMSSGVMRLTRIELSPARLNIEASFIFPDEATALAFYYPGDNRPHLPVEVVDPRGIQDFYGTGSMGFAEDSTQRMKEPKHQVDGTFVWLYRSEYWYLAPESDTYYLLLDISGLPEDKVYTGDLMLDFSNAIRLGG